MAGKWGTGGLAEAQGPEPRPRARDDRRHGRGGRQRGGAQRRGSRTGGVVGERIDLLELALDGLGQGEGIEAGAHRRQLRDSGRVGLRGVHDALEGRAGRVIAPADAGADPVLAHELHRRQEEVLQEPGPAGRDR